MARNILQYSTHTIASLDATTVVSVDPAVPSTGCVGSLDRAEMDQLYGLDNWVLVVEGMDLLAAGRMLGLRGVVGRGGLPVAGTPVTWSNTTGGFQSVFFRCVITPAEISAAAAFPITQGGCGFAACGWYRDAGVNLAIGRQVVYVAPREAGLISVAKLYS